MSDNNASDEADEFEALQIVIGKLRPYGDEARRRILEAAATFLKIKNPVAAPMPTGGTDQWIGPAKPTSSFSEDRAMSPKEFLFEKRPQSNVERIACLAYYLTHYRETPFFKTLDLSKLNTEAAQPKFANSTMAVNDAGKQGYLVAAAKGQKQMSAAGEQFVLALPDREAARAAMISTRPKRKKKAKARPPRTGGDSVSE